MIQFMKGGGPYGEHVAAERCGAEGRPAGRRGQADHGVRVEVQDADALLVGEGEPGRVEAAGLDVHGERRALERQSETGR